MTRYRFLLAAAVLATATPSIAAPAAFDGNALAEANDRALDAATAYHLSETQAGDRARQAWSADSLHTPDPTALKPAPPAFPASSAHDLDKLFIPPSLTTSPPPIPAAKAPQPMPFTFGKILDNPDTRALGIEGMTP